MYYVIEELSKSVVFHLTHLEAEGLWAALSHPTDDLDTLEKRFVELAGFQVVPPTDNGDMTDGIIFTNGVYEWWDTNYQVRSFLNELALGRRVSLPFARAHAHPVTQEEATEFLADQVCFEGLAGKVYFTFCLQELMPDISIQDLEETLAESEFLAALEKAELRYRYKHSVDYPFPFYKEFADSNIELEAEEQGDERVASFWEWDSDKIIELARQVWLKRQAVQLALNEIIEKIEDGNAWNDVTAEDEGSEHYTFRIGRKRDKEVKLGVSVRFIEGAHNVDRVRIEHTEGTLYSIDTSWIPARAYVSVEGVDGDICVAITNIEPIELLELNT